MRLEPGTYRATAPTVIALRRSNSDARANRAPSTRETYDLDPGDTFTVPPTVNDFYYDGEPSQLRREPDA